TSSLVLFPWVRSARTRLPCTCACEAFPPALAAHALPGKSGSRPGLKSTLSKDPVLSEFHTVLGCIICTRLL
ncbi:hypothetical protein EV363DRAFT_777233, partial [Boletus edulis]